MSDSELARLLILAARFSTEDVGKILALSGVKLKNPVVEFKTRMKAGDFELLSSEEKAMVESGRALRVGREPLSDAEYEERKKVSIELSRYWNGAEEVSALDVLYAMTNGFDKAGVWRMLGM